MGEVIRGGSTSLTSAEFGVLDDRPSPSMLVLVATLAAATVCQGAFTAAGRWLVGLGLVAAIGLDVTMSRSVAVRHGRLGAAATALAIWITVRDVADGSLDGGPARVGLLVGVAAVVVIVLRSQPLDRATIASAVLAIGVGVAASGWVGVVWHIEPWAMRGTSTWRASSTLTYPNAAAAITVGAALLAISARTVRPRSVWHAIATTALLIGAVATQSRAGAVAATFGAAVLVHVAGPRRVIGATAGPALGAVVACAGLAPGLSVDRSEQPASAVVGLLVGLGIAAASTRVPAVVQRRLATIAATAVVFVLGAAAFGRARWWSSDRLSLTSSDRRGTNAAAFDVLQDHALVGVGPGDLRVVFPTPGGLVTTTLVHDEYLQLAVELGIIGAALAAVCACLTMRSLAASRHRSGDRWMWNGAVAALTALAVHSAFDFLWHIPAVVLVVAAIVALGCAPASSVPNTNHERHHT